MTSCILLLILTQWLLIHYHQQNTWMLLKVYKGLF